MPFSNSAAALQPKAGGAAKNAAALYASKILVVDDSPTTRELMRACIAAEGFANVATAADGGEALRVVEEQTPDLVILDLAMPVLDGFQTCAALRERPATRDVPILVQSATDKASDIARAFEVGANDILGKPFKPIELTRRMRVHLENRQMIKSLLTFRQRVEQELDSAREMQQFICPSRETMKAASVRHGLDLGAAYRPTSEIGGDIWGLIDGEEQLSVYLADFAGHGVPAALNTFRLHTMISRLGSDPIAPEAALGRLNNELCGALRPGQFATMIWASLNRRTGLLSYATAGSPPPLIWPAGPDGLPRLGKGSGLPCGFVKDVVYERHDIQTAPGFRFMMFSDALIEARGPGGEMIGEDGLLRRAAPVTSAQFDADQLVNAVVAETVDRGDIRIDDDLTVIALSKPAQDGDADA